jgi:hypothetical protein
LPETTYDYEILETPQKTLHALKSGGQSLGDPLIANHTSSVDNIATQRRPIPFSDKVA